MKALASVCDFLAPSDQPEPCDVIFVLAGRDDRKPYGLKLFQQGLAPRLILSVGRYEVRQTASTFDRPELLEIRDSLPASRRHFWMDFLGGDVRISPANLRETNTFWELYQVSDYLGTKPSRIALVSTSIHLRRMRYCCSLIPSFQSRSIQFLAVPEETSSFQKRGWWKRADHWWYVISEYLKLAGYHVLYHNESTFF